MSRVFVLDAERRPLSPCTPARARLLLKAGKAAILRRCPFVLLLKTSRPDAVVEPLRVKIDPGAHTSGIALLNDGSGEVVWAAEVHHRGPEIREALGRRRAVRRSRRQRTTRYRPKRFANRRRPAGWLAPSLLARVLNLLTWVARLRRFCPVGMLSKEFGFPHLMGQAKAPLVGAAVMNATRWSLYQALQQSGLPVEVGSGGQTSYHRVSRNLPKAHWIDAALVGASTPEHLGLEHVCPWLIKATGWQSRQMCLMSKHGFPRTRAKQRSLVKGFRTGALVRAVVKEGTKAGSYQGRVAVRASGSFNLTTQQETVQGIHVRWCRLLQQKDGYQYQ